MRRGGLLLCSFLTYAVPAWLTYAVPAMLTYAVPAMLTYAVPAMLTYAVPAWLTYAVPAMAQDTPEARLRELLRRTTAELRAAQDSQALLQAALDQEKQKTATLQKQLDERPVEKPAVPEVEKPEVKARVAALETGLKQWQDAYQKAADAVRAKAAESQTATAQAAESKRQVSVCSEANTRLEAVANEILHLYQTQGFRSLLLASYEPLLGLKKVELENTIQDYEDKLLDQKYRPGRDAAQPR